MPQKKSLSATFLAGSASGTCATLLLQPLDLVKTRLQVQVPTTGSACTISSHPVCVRSGMLKIMSSVVRHENVSGLWRGLSPSLSRCVPGVGLYFTTLTALQQSVVPEDRAPTALEALAIGGLSRSITCGALLPVTVIKTRFESGRFHYSSVLSALLSIKHQEGFRGLYSGCSATLLRDAPFSGLYYLFYSEGKKGLGRFHERYGFYQQQALLQFSVGVLAGVAACAITQPADVVKTRVQSQVAPHANTLSVIANIYKTEGVSTFSYGFAPRALRRSLNAALAWTLFDMVLARLQLR